MAFSRTASDVVSDQAGRRDGRRCLALRISAKLAA
ncbi:hypothetical protein SAMN05192568_100333 [Methylobacterium pseudosasicola]|uniref:Uncharacterized protein n=1 Tax=Methylobacterium pseudosasicola TaxID=582667 RepID=A0A1I4GKN2_9HYPH|nr:hypothetical protein SAMN05192568_100333 [Methylobacterium pseudosasicola]